MRKFSMFFLLAVCLLMAGCDQASSQNKFELPFAEEDVVSVEAYYYQANFTNSARKKTATEPDDIQYLYTSFNSISAKSADRDPDKYGADISACRFHLKDGSFYEIVYEGYGVKDGFFTTSDREAFSTTADINGVWHNLSVDAEGCDEGELLIPFYAEAVQETWQPKVFSGEEADVHQLVFDYLALKQVDFVSEVDHSTEDYFVPELGNSLEEQLFWKVFRFEKLVRFSIREKILWEEFDIKITNISIVDNTATVDAYDVYVYELADADGTISSRGTGYTVSCRKVEDRWYISGIDTDNELIEAHVEGYSAEELPSFAGVGE